MSTRARRLLLPAVSAVALAAAGCGGEGEIPTVRADGQYEALAPTAPAGGEPTEQETAVLTSSPQPSPTATAEPTTTPSATTTTAPEATPSPVVTETATEAATEPADEGPTTGGDDGQTYALDPAGPVSLAAGDDVEITFGDRYDDGELPAAIDVILVICEDVETRDGQLRFIDANDEGTADGRLSDSSRAAITGLNGTDVDPRASVSDLLLRNGEASVTVAPDECVWAVFFTDRDGDGELAVDGDDLPEEVFGATKVDVG